MGSWYGTCGVSQLPIIDHDDVAVLFMKENKHKDVDYMGCVGSDNLYRPVSPAIFGKYNDYGRVGNVEFDKRIISDLYGNQDNYDNVDKLIDEKSVEKGLYFMFVHLGIYREVVKRFGEGKEFYTEDLSLREFNKNKMICYLQKERKSVSSLSFMNYNHFKYSTDYSLDFYQDHAIYEGSIKEDPLVDSVVDLLVFKHAMTTSRKFWIPQAGQGSQDRSYDIAEIVGEFTLEKKNADYEDDY